MDTELARTFLTVIAAGNFRNAASRLFVTQSTVSARISRRQLSAFGKMRTTWVCRATDKTGPLATIGTGPPR